MAEIYIIDAPTNPVRFNVNGTIAVVMVGTDAEVPDEIIPALDDAAGIKWRYADEPPMDAEGSDDFDAEAALDGSLEDFEGRLGDMTNEQMLAVLEAEEARDKPRKGIRERVEKEISARNDNA